MPFKKLNKWLNQKTKSLDPEPSPKKEGTPSEKKTPIPSEKKKRERGQRGGHASYTKTNSSQKDGKKRSPSGGSKQRLRPASRTQVKNLEQKSEAQRSSIQKLIKDFTSSKEPKLRICPLGGLEQVGGNMMFIEYENDIIIIDSGIEFADADLLGVDYSIPDVSYLEERKEHIRALIITHGHLDHIGAIPYILTKIGNPPLYGTSLTMGLVRKQLEEFALDKSAKVNVIDPSHILSFGKYVIDFFRVNHSIPDGIGLRIKTPVGNIVHTSDFKFDFTPADKTHCDIEKMAKIGDEGVLALLSDSTGAYKSGFTKSEEIVGNTLHNIIQGVTGRLIIASFSSLIGRIQQIIEYAEKHERQIFIAGRSLVNNLEIATKTGHIKVKKGTLKKLTPAVNQLPDRKILILTTGSQGEPMAALSRIALGDHQNLMIKKGDTVCFSSSPIIGNERAITNVIDNLTKLGARVITHSGLDVHTSGHGYQGDLMLMYNLMKPKYYLPIHGEYHMRVQHKNIIMKGCNHPENRTELLMNGDIIEFDREQNGRKSKHKIPLRPILVDGLGVGDIGTAVIRERKTMSESGVIVILFRVYSSSKRLISDPDVMSRGFIFLKSSESISHDIRQVAKKSYNTAIAKNQQIELRTLKRQIQGDIEMFIHRRIERHPLIMPIISFI